MPTKSNTIPTPAANLSAAPKSQVTAGIADGDAGQRLEARLIPASVSDIGPEVEVALPLDDDNLGGGPDFEPVSLPQGKYVVAGNVVIWPLKHTEDSNWHGLFPLRTLLRLDGYHESRLVRKVIWGPETADWTVLELDGFAVLVRPADLTVLVEE